MSLQRHSAGPILARNDIPAVPPAFIDVSSVFNPGAVRFRNRDLLLLRVQNRARETAIMVAESQDGIHFSVQPRLVEIHGLKEMVGKQRPGDAIYHIYDPRITRIGEVFYVMFAMDMDYGCGLGLARTEDFQRFDCIGVSVDEDIRNGVLFPEKIGGRYLRLDRPNRSRLDNGVVSGDTIWLSESADLVSWNPVGPVFSGRWHFWDERIGAGPPPVKTRDGWLLVYHGVATHFSSCNIYQAGVALLDLENPATVKGRCRYNILEPRELYELTGQVPNVIFPSGMIVDNLDADGFALPDSPVRIYYGAADTVVGLATTTIRDLLNACQERSGNLPAGMP